jgi:hypothetical protein
MTTEVGGGGDESQRNLHEQAKRRKALFDMGVRYLDSFGVNYAAENERVTAGLLDRGAMFDTMSPFMYAFQTGNTEIFEPQDILNRIKPMVIPGGRSTLQIYTNYMLEDNDTRLPDGLVTKTGNSVPYRVNLGALHAKLHAVPDYTAAFKIFILGENTDLQKVHRIEGITSSGNLVDPKNYWDTLRPEDEQTILEAIALPYLGYIRNKDLSRFVYESVQFITLLHKYKPEQAFDVFRVLQEYKDKDLVEPDEKGFEELMTNIETFLLSLYPEYKEPENP